MAASKQIGSLSVFLSLDNKEFNRKLKLMQKDLGKFGKNLESVGKTLTAAVTLPIAGIGIAAIKAAADLEETQSKFNAVFKGLSGEVRKFAKEQASSLNRSSSDLEKYLATFQDTFVPLGFARDEAANLSKQLTILSLDLASFNNVADQQALEDLQSAIVGNVETMRKYGVIINQTVLNQELLNMGIAGGVKSATEAQKANARLNLILKGTTDAQGDAARTAGSFTNQLKGTIANIKQLAEDLGQRLIPVATKLLKVFNELASSLLALPDRTKAWALGLSGLAAAAGPAAVAVGKIVQTVSDRKFLNSLKSVTTAFSAMSLKLTAVVVTVFTLVTLFQTLGDLFPILGKGIEKLQEFFIEGFNNMLKGSQKLIEFLADAAETFGDSEFAEKLRSIGKDIKEGLLDTESFKFAEKAANTFADNFKKNLEFVEQLAKSVGGAISGEITKIGDTFQETFKPSGTETPRDESTPGAKIPVFSLGAEDVNNAFPGLEDLKSSLRSSAEEFGQIITDGFVTPWDEALNQMRDIGLRFAEDIGSFLGKTLVEGWDTSSLDQVLNIFADFVGKLIPLAVTAVVAKAGLDSVLAGPAAIAFAAAAGAAMSALLKSSMRGSGKSVSSGNVSSGSGGGFGSVQRASTDISVNGNWQVSGNQLQLVLDRNNASNLNSFGFNGNG